MVQDYIGSPPFFCLEHGESYYSLCRRCFDSRYDEPVHLRVARGPAGEGRPGKRK